jgi:hypothetical protein
MRQTKPVPPPVKSKRAPTARRTSKRPAEYFRTVPDDVYRSALREFVTAPRESYTRTEIAQILGHPFLPSDVRCAELVEVPNSKPIRYTTESLYHALSAPDVQQRIGFFGGVRRVLPILSDPAAQSVTLPPKILHAIIGLFFQKHEQSQCEHEWAEPIGDYPPDCRYCKKPSAPGPRDEPHNHCTIALNDWPFATETPRNLCIECFEADAPHPGMQWAPKRLPLEDAREQSLRAMNDAWSRISHILERACK